MHRFFASRPVLHVALLFVAAAFLAQHTPTLLGQNMASTASVSGIVTDPQGARVAGASLTLSSQDQGITRKFTTTSTGTYSFSLLPPATYTPKNGPASRETDLAKVTKAAGNQGFLKVFKGFFETSVGNKMTFTSSATA